MVASVIAEGRATLHELRTIYSLQDLYTIWEACYVPKYNLYKAQEHAAEMQKLRNKVR